MPVKKYPKPFVCYYYANKSRHQETKHRNGSKISVAKGEVGGKMEDGIKEINAKNAKETS
jgi:hypothetical protein